MTDTNLSESNMSSDEPKVKDFFFDFLIPGVILVVVGVFGFVGNSISIYILSTGALRSSINSLLTGNYSIMYNARILKKMFVGCELMQMHLLVGELTKFMVV